MEREFNPDLTNPDISLPENPLEELIDLDQKITQASKLLVGRTIIYAGTRIKVDKLNFDLSIVGKDENGVTILVPENDLQNCEIVEE